MSSNHKQLLMILSRLGLSVLIIYLRKHMPFKRIATDDPPEEGISVEVLVQKNL